MDITQTGSGTYMLSAQRDEFDEHSITKEQAEAAVMSALKLPFLPCDTVIELYDCKSEIVIFTHIPPSFYAFENFEDVISACKNCSCDNSSLYCYDGEYILSVSLPHIVFNEFAGKIDSPHGFDAYLKEHGNLLIASDAVNFVKNTF